MSDTNPPVVVSPYDEMTDRELLEEIATSLREFSAALELIGENPMLQAIMTGQNPLTAMMGR